MAEKMFQGDMSQSLKNMSTGAVDKRFGGYSKQLKAYSESVKGKRNTNFKTDFVGMMLAGGDSLAKMKNDGLMGTLHTEREKIQDKLASARPGEMATYMESAKIINADIKFISDRLDTSFKLFSEAAGSNMLKPNQQTVLPLQVLETLQNNARLVVPFQNTEVRTMPRQRIVKQLIVDGVAYNLPYAMANPEVMSKILNEDTKRKTHRLDLTAGSTFNLITMYGPDAVPGKDKLNPLITLKSIEVVDGATTKVIAVPKTNDTKITWKSRGKFSVIVVDSATSKEYQIAGQLDFTDGTIKPLVSTDVKAMSVETSISGGTFQRTFSATETRQDHDFVVDEQISAQYTYNILDLQDKLTLENIDGLLAATSIIYDTAVNVKDYYCFDQLENFWDELKSGAILGGIDQPNNSYEVTADLAPTAPNNTVYKPQDPVTWRNVMIPEALSKIAFQYKMKLESRQGYTAVFWSNPLITRLIGQLNVVLGGDTGEYAGVATDMTVMSGSVQGQNVRIVSTRRVPTDATYLRSIALSNEPNEETFVFWQYFTFFDTDGKVRNPQNLALPTVSYLDLFKMDSIHTIMGTVNLGNIDKAFAY